MAYSVIIEPEPFRGLVLSGILAQNAAQLMAQRPEMTEKEAFAEALHLFDSAAEHLAGFFRGRPGVHVNPVQ